MNGGDGVIHDITGTTVYVVAVICVIPVAGLVAWVVRYVVKKKVRNSFISSVSPELLHSLASSRLLRNQAVEYVRTGDGSDFWHVQDQSSFSDPYCIQTIGHRWY